MKLTIFGSTGGIGRQIVAQALEQGHRVTAFTRSPDKLGRPHENLPQENLPHENLEVVKGDVLDPASVERAIRGADAVLCALGMPLMNKENLRAIGTKNIVRAMVASSVGRLVCLSALGAGDSRGILPFHYRNLIVPLLMRRLFADHEIQESSVKKSPLDWVIVRPGNFAKGRRTGAYRHGFSAADRAPKLRISRADVADFMLKQLADDTYLHKTPSLSY